MGLPNFSITQPFSLTTPFLHIAGITNNGTIRFIIGNTSPYRVLKLNLNIIDCRRPLKLTTINNSPEFSSGIVIDATTNVSLRNTGVKYLRLDKVASKKLTYTGKFQGNTYNTNGNSDMVFERNNIEYFRLLNAPVGYPILDWTNTTASAGISSSIIFANIYFTRSETQDTVFRGNPPSGTGNRVEYVRYDYANSQVSYSYVINNIGRNIVGNIIDTIVSDERLKN